MTAPEKPMSCAELELCLAEMADGELEPERLEALLAHVERCESCRREWQAWQTQEEQLRRYFTLEREKLAQATSAPPPPAAVPARPRLPRLAWAAAALFFLALGVGTWVLYLQNVPTGDAVLATVKTAQGRVQTLEGGIYLPLASGAPLRQGQRLKVAEGGYAALEYPNGNILEVRGGTRLVLRELGDRTEVALDRGQVWAHLHVKPRKKFVIATERLRAVATGTVYSVQDGIGQTVVAVAEGSVRVEGAGAPEARVDAGGVYTSRPDGQAGPLGQLTAWSQYPQDLAALTPPAAPADAGAAPLAVPAPPAPATPTPAPSAAPRAVASALNDLVDALPADTRAFMEIRDWPRLCAQFNGSAYAALTQEPALRQWWQAIHGSDYLKEFTQEIRLLELIEIFRKLDGQVVLAVTPEQGDVLLLADCRAREEEVRARIEQLFTGEADPTQPGALARRAEDWKKLHDHVTLAQGRLIVSSSPVQVKAALERVTQNQSAGFKASAFYRKVAAATQDPGFIAAINMNGIWGPQGKDKSFDDMVRLLGLRGMDTLVIAPRFNGRGMNQAARLGFAGNRFGAMNWLAEPGPMRAFDFFSSDVHFFAAARVRSLRQLFFDYLIYRYTSQGEGAMQRARAFFDRHEALFDAFGGEVALGIDNPLLPIPNIKIVAELADRPAFESQLDGLLAQMIQDMEREGRFADRQAQDYNGIKVHSLLIDNVPFQPAWAFVDDFVICGPGPAFVQHSIDVYKTGRSIGNDPHLTALFPSGAGTHFSLLVYQDIAKAMPGLIKNKIMPQAGREAAPFVPDLSFLERYRAPGIAYANANPQSVDLFLSTPTGIDFNMGMAVPLVANWLAPHLNIGLAADMVADAYVGLRDLAQGAAKFKAEHGRYPASPGELAHPIGKYLSGDVPRDPFGLGQGDTLRMIPAKDGQGVVFYSIGPDGVDNKGALELKPEQALEEPGDIVVRVP